MYMSGRGHELRVVGVIIEVEVGVIIRVKIKTIIPVMIIGTARVMIDVHEWWRV